MVLLVATVCKPGESRESGVQSMLPETSVLGMCTRSECFSVTELTHLPVTSDMVRELLGVSARESRSSCCSLLAWSAHRFGHQNFVSYRAI